MKSLYRFIIKPKESRYDNEKKVGDKTLITNTKIETFQSVSKKAIVLSLPKAYKTLIGNFHLNLKYHIIIKISRLICKYNFYLGDPWVKYMNFIKCNNFLCYIDHFLILILKFISYTHQIKLINTCTYECISCVIYYFLLRDEPHPKSFILTCSLLLFLFYFVKFK